MHHRVSKYVPNLHYEMCYFDNYSEGVGGDMYIRTHTQHCPSTCWCCMYVLDTNPLKTSALMTHILYIKESVILGRECSCFRMLGCFCKPCLLINFLAGTCWLQASFLSAYEVRLYNQPANHWFCFANQRADHWFRVANEWAYHRFSLANQRADHGFRCANKPTDHWFRLANQRADKWIPFGQ